MHTSQSYHSEEKSGNFGQSTNMRLQLWKVNNEKAQKNGGHHTIYWVKPQQKYEDGTFKGEKWKTSSKYIGDWKENKKCGFGIQYYGNGDKYEGGWDNHMRNGHGTLWVLDGKKLRREYTGEWINDKKSGRGTMYFKNEDRYDGFWLNDLPHGEGRMIYHNGDIYEGQWSLGKKSGYGVLTKRNGDHFEGQWVNDKREGQGSYFFASKNKVFVGEWVDDMPKAGVYSEVEDPDAIKQNKPKQFTDAYDLPNIPQIKLENPSNVLEDALEEAKQARLFYRARFIPINELFSQEELKDLLREFNSATNEKDTLNLINLRAILYNLNFDQTEEEIKDMLMSIEEEVNPEEVDFELFCRLVAVYLELANNPKADKPQTGDSYREEQESEVVEEGSENNY
jgi:hypothetical protein